MGTQAIIVAAVLLLLIISLYKELLRPSVSFVIAIALLVVTQVISPQEALLGFANEQLWVIILLLILSTTLSKTSMIESFFAFFFKGARTSSGFIVKLLPGLGIPSALLNNTPLVAMMMPYVSKWSADKDIAPSKLFIPLSYISILGGCVTLIGTSTNLIVNGLAIEYGEESLGIFDFAPVGLSMLVLGVLYLYFTHDRLLPDHRSMTEQGDAREYVVETVIKAGSPLIGKEIQDGGLRHLDGLFLVKVIRDERHISPVNPNMQLLRDDVLIFVGDTHKVLDITKPQLGLSLPKSTEMPVHEMKEVVEIVLAPQSLLRGQRVQDSDFRGRFNAAILAIHRNGERVEGKIGDIVLEAGDAMLVLTGDDFLSRTQNGRDFYLVSKVRDFHEAPVRSSYLLLLGLGLAIVLAMLSWVPLFTSLFVLVLITLVTGLQPANELRTKVDFDLIFIIVMGLALGKAMINSGVAQAVSESVTQVLGPVGAWSLIAGFFLVTNVLSSFMTSKAAVAMVLPVALTAAHTLGLPVAPFILVVAFGGAANFITPIGYQTNLMVYGPGGYAFKDYMRIGLPLTIIYLIVTTIILTLSYNL